MAILPQLARIPKIIPFAHLWSEEISDLLYLRLHSGGVQHCWEEDIDIYVFRISDLIKKYALKTVNKRLSRSAAIGGVLVAGWHIGSYDDEPATVEMMHEYMEKQGYVLDITDQRLHHEMYLSDARKVAPEKLKTVIRHPIKKRGE